MNVLHLLKQSLEDHSELRVYKVIEKQEKKYNLFSFSNETIWLIFKQLGSLKIKVANPHKKSKKNMKKICWRRKKN